MSRTAYALVKETYAPLGGRYSVKRCPTTGEPVAVVTVGPPVSGAYSVHFVPPWVGRQREKTPGGETVKQAGVGVTERGKGV